jgi:hypothetical protein
VGGTGNVCTDNLVSNTVGTTSAGIRWNGATDCVIAHNVCWDDQGTKTQGHGMRAYGNNQNVLVIGNHLTGNLTGTIDEAVLSAASSGYVKRHNRPSGIDNPEVLPIVAGAIGESSFSGVSPLNGSIGIDSTNGRLYLKYGNAWHYIAVTA